MDTHNALMLHGQQDITETNDAYMCHPIAIIAITLITLCKNDKSGD